MVDDRGWGRRVVVEKTGSNATVVWNPWIAKAKAMPDFGDEEWPSMLCLETCNVREQSVVLAPGHGVDAPEPVMHLRVARIVSGGPLQTFQRAWLLPGRHVRHTEIK